MRRSSVEMSEYAVPYAGFAEQVAGTAFHASMQLADSIWATPTPLWKSRSRSHIFSLPSRTFVVRSAVSGGSLHPGTTPGQPV